MNQRLLRPERSALARLSYTPAAVEPTLDQAILIASARRTKRAAPAAADNPNLCVPRRHGHVAIGRRKGLLRFDRGREVTASVQRLRHIDSSTSHSSQSATADRFIVNERKRDRPRFGTFEAHQRYRVTTEFTLSFLPMANGREILPELLKLPAHERAMLATELVQSLDESEDPNAAEAWLEELDRRAREVVSETTKLADWTEVRRRIELRSRAR